MKIRFVVLGILLLAAAVAGIWMISRPEKAPIEKHELIQKEYKLLDVSVSPLEVSLQADGKVMYANEQNVFFSVSGLLEKGEVEVKSGTKFSKGQLLFQINNREAFKKMWADKKQLKTKLEALLTELKTKFPSREKEWDDFINSIGPGNLLADLPEVKSADEKKWLTEHAIPEAHKKIKQMESAMADYFYIAPFDGYLTNVETQPGINISSKQIIASISKTKKKMIVCSVSKASYQDFESAPTAFVTVGKSSFTGQIQKTKANPSDKGKLDVYLTTKENGWSDQDIKVKLQGYTRSVYATIPGFVPKYGHVHVLQDGEPVGKNISIVSTRKDSVVVTGLETGDQLILNY